MLSYDEIHVLKVALEKGYCDFFQLRKPLAIANNRHLSLVQILMKNNLLQPGRWKECLKEARSRDNWPQNPDRVRRENDLIYDQLKARGNLDQGELDKARRQCRHLASPTKSIRLHELLLQKDLITNREIQEWLGVRDRALLQCSQCETTYEIVPFWPWSHCPCLRDGTDLSLVEEKTREKDTRDETKPRPAKVGKKMGKKFDKYTIETKLGEGGMGEVYKAYDEDKKRTVALKVISEMGPDRIQRFQREIKLTIQLSHPHIVRVYEVGRINGIPYYAMEYLEGVDLGGYVEKNGPLEVERALDTVEKVAEAVVYAHSRQVMHRDIKPENILLTLDGEPKLTDFGLAKEIRDNATRITQSGMIVGSPEFMAPEQVRGEKEVGFGADIYALGGTLYFMLSGRPPFEGEDVMDLLLAKVEEDPEKLSRYVPEIDRKLEVIVHKCLAKEVEDRYATVEDFLEDLHSLRRGEPILARPTQMRKRLGRWVRRHRTGFTLGVMAFLITLSVAIGVYLGRNHSPTPQPSPGPSNPQSGKSPTSVKKKADSDRLAQEKLREIKNLFERLAKNRRNRRLVRRRQERERMVRRVLDLWVPGAVDLVISQLKPDSLAGSWIALDALAEKRDKLSDSQRQLIFERFQSLPERYTTGRHKWARELGQSLKAIDPERYQRWNKKELESATNRVLERVKNMMERGKWKRAEDRLNLFLKKYPTNGEGRLYRARTRREQGKWKGAEEDGKVAVEKLPRRAEAWSEWGLIAMARSDWATGARRYDRALQLNPGHGMYLGRRATCLVYLGRWSEAEPGLTQALAKVPHRTDFYLYRAWCWIEKDRLGKALEDWSKVLERNYRHREREMVEGKLAKQVRKLMKRYLSSPPLEQREVKGKMIQWGGAVLPFLAELLSDSAEDLQTVAAHAFQWFPRVSRPYEKKLASLLKHENPQIRGHAAIALGKMGQVGKRTMDGLIGLLNSSRKSDVLVATRAVGDLGANGGKAVPHLMAKLSSAQGEERRAFFTALHDIGRPAAPHLVRYLVRVKGKRRQEVAQVLVAMKGKATPHLVKLLDHRNKEIQQLVLSILVKIGSPSVPALIQGLAHKNYVVRMCSAYALGKLGRRARGARRILEQIAKTDPSGLVRRTSEDALREITK